MDGIDQLLDMANLLIDFVPNGTEISDQMYIFFRMCGKRKVRRDMHHYVLSGS